MIVEAPGCRGRITSLTALSKREPEDWFERFCGLKPGASIEERCVVLFFHICRFAVGYTPFLFEGTLTRTVEDAALGLTALAGYDPRDPFSLADQVDFLAATRRS